MSPALLEDALEAVIGALYLDSGLETAREFILEILSERIEEHSKKNNEDFKADSR